MVGQGFSHRLSAKVRRSVQRRTSSTSFYRGADRRGVVAADTPSPGRLFIVAGFSLLGLVAVVLVASGPLAGRDSDTTWLFVAQLEAAALALALLVAGLCFVRWRLVGEAAVLWLGTAAALYGLTGLAFGYIETLTSATGAAGLLWLEPAGRLVVLALVVLAISTPQVDASLRPRRTVLVALVGVAWATLGLHALPGLARFTATTGDAVGGGIEGTAVVALLWGTVAAWAIVVGLRERRHLIAWVSLTFFGLCFAYLATAGSTAATAGAALGPAVLQLAALVCAVLGATAELARAYTVQGSKLLETVASERSATAAIEVERASQAELFHEARNALAAIEGATRTLQRFQDQMDASTRTELADAVSGEVHRLQELIRRPPLTSVAHGEPGRFRLTEGLAAVVTCARSQGTVVHLDVPDHLVAIGHPADTAQVLHNLLQNARRYAGGEVLVHAAYEGNHVVIRVEDDGPGIPVEERARIFERGVRGSTVSEEAGSGLGLYISARLIRQQGGDLWVEDSRLGGACFAVALPGFSELAVNGETGEQSAYDGEEAGEFVLPSEATIVEFRRRSEDAGSVHFEDGVRGDALR